MEEEKILFYERQRLRQWWLWLIVILAIVVPAVIQISKMSDSGVPQQQMLYYLLSYIACCIPVLLLICCIKLETKITEKCVYVRLFPLQISFRSYAFSEMSAYFVRKYHPVREYGGWGLKGTFNNRALNISGNQGLQIVFKNEKKLLIGTRRPQEIMEILKSLQSNKK